jgi:ADP-ribose pyrophosphatase
MDKDRDFRETPIASREVFRGRLLRLTVDTVLLPSGEQATREVVHHCGAVGVVALDDEGQVLLVEQWRHATGQLLLEIPAGARGHDEDPECCARRELAEEIGFVPRRLEVLTEMYTAPGYVGESIRLYLARDLYEEAADGDEDESLRVVRMSLPEAIEACRSGRICDGKSISALMLAREYLQAEGRTVG